MTQDVYLARQAAGNAAALALEEALRPTLDATATRNAPEPEKHGKSMASPEIQTRPEGQHGI